MPGAGAIARRIREHHAPQHHAGLVSQRPDRDAPGVNRFLNPCDVQTALGENLARGAAHLRGLARRGSAVDAVVAAERMAPSGTAISMICDPWPRT
jgi:hypothetical protein